MFGWLAPRAMEIGDKHREEKGREEKFQRRRQIRWREKALDNPGEEEHRDGAEKEARGAAAGLRERVAARKQPREEQTTGNLQARAAGDENRREFEDAMGRDETPELAGHAGAPGGGANHANQEPVEDHHPEGSKTRCDAEGECGKGHGEIVGHDPGGFERFHGNNGMRPHFAALDGFHHLRPKQAVGEGGIAESYHPGHDACEREHGKGQQGLPECFAENSGVGFRVEADEAAQLGPVAHVDEIVGAAEQLVQVDRKLAAGDVFAHRGEIGGRLTI